MERRIKWLWLPLLSLALCGCFDDPDIALMVDAIEWDLYPATLDAQAELRFGSGSLGLARSVCSWVPDCETEVAELLQDVRQLHVGVYEIDGRGGGAPLVMTDELRLEMADMGWQVALTAHDAHGESQWVLARVVDEELRGLYLVCAEDDEVVVVKAEGALSRILDRALCRDRDLYAGVQGMAEEL